MDVKRSLDVGRAWRYPDEGCKNTVDSRKDHGYATTCLINLLTTSDRVFLEKLTVP
jgi:hypothetical protein